jgi:hypothetical protein
VFFALDDTGAGNEEQAAVADADIVELEGSGQFRVPGSQFAAKK